MTKDLTKNKKILTIAGSDILSGGGMQADLATFAHDGFYGFCALTSIVTVREDKFFVHPVEEQVFKDQLRSLQSIDFSAVKIGLLPNRKHLQLTKEFLSALTETPIILDPVIVFKENDDYSVNEMRELFIRTLIPISTVITPNLREAEILSAISISTIDDMKEAARILYRFGTKNVVIKGGNRFNPKYAIDLAYDGEHFYELSNPVLDKNNNGAGCTFAASIATHLAQRDTFEQAVGKAKSFVYQAIQNSNQYGVFQNAK
ncbi:bifunctional hydroxymethylpyrimidine kinase/phosphomethylpyrimidine kinase [Lactococcus allomyrinae]|uniref:pyridoxal kinase n=1 Tax=Lactococcus allomyrinae TaxID=2419773 RepID=A0A387BLG8_9LACT|nr:bifunctional hydroxymethylpyrimidine kinase/phosphomethylpyrimidine kinase [Lactococcus allomyrinae]AYG01846.1 bifunctional hydroxymethylpyrimidine kinase/phosphomethylpyrimidine kinase [Lactococcus allomyrinae]